MKPSSRSTTVAHRNESTYERNRISTTISVSVVFWLLPLGPRRRSRLHRRPIKMKIDAAKKVTVDAVGQKQTRTQSIVKYGGGVFLMLQISMASGMRQSETIEWVDDPLTNIIFHLAIGRVEKWKTGGDGGVGSCEALPVVPEITNSRETARVEFGS
jgi:hypothetical protein